MSESALKLMSIGGTTLTRAGMRSVLAEYEAEIMPAAPNIEPLLDQLGEVDVVILLDDQALPLLLHHTNDQPAILLISQDLPHPMPQQRAWGVVTTDAYPQEIWASLQALQLGLCVLSPSILAQIHAPPQREPLDTRLSEREHEVLQLLAEGLTNRQIAQRLVISEHTVKFHVSALLSKLDVASRTEAIRVGAQRGLIIW